MKCPFKKNIKITRGIKIQYKYPKDLIEQDFGECEKEECMAYSLEEKTCIKLK